MSSPDVSEFALISAELQAEPDSDVTARTIVEHAAEIVPRCEHVSVTIALSGGRYTTLASTSDLAVEVDAKQYELGEGPCVGAAEGTSWFRSGDVASDPRWPAWGPAASERGVRSVLAVRLITPDAGTDGALNFYSCENGAFADQEVVDMAQVYAVHATNALAAARHATGLQTALTSRHTIGLAQGILMERFGLTPQSSFDLLRRTSSVHNVKLREVATRLVESGELPGIPSAN